MGFHTGLTIGQELTNKELTALFECGNMGGMRRSKHTGTLVLINDNTKGIYRDVWKDGILHYTGMGKRGDQVLQGNQNKTLYESKTNGVEVHLFEVMERAIYTYRGIVALVDNPYQAKQPDEDGNMRNVWIFPVKPIAEYKDMIEEPSERELARLSSKELARRLEINQTNREPKTTEAKVYYRDPYLKEMVKRIAKGNCQYCGKEAPFKDKFGEPYLEEHHVKSLADGGKDTIENVVAICPNCHRKMHVLKDENDIFILEQIAEQNKESLERVLVYDIKMLQHFGE